MKIFFLWMLCLRENELNFNLLFELNCFWRLCLEFLGIIDGLFVIIGCCFELNRGGEGVW